MVMTADGFARVRTALRQFVQHVPDGLEVGILRTDEMGRQSPRLSADRQDLLDRIEAMRRGSPTSSAATICCPTSRRTARWSTKSRRPSGSYR